MHPICFKSFEMLWYALNCTRFDENTSVLIKNTSKCIRITFKMQNRCILKHFGVKRMHLGALRPACIRYASILPRNASVLLQMLPICIRYASILGVDHLIFRRFFYPIFFVDTGRAAFLRAKNMVELPSLLPSLYLQLCTIRGLGFRFARKRCCGTGTSSPCRWP